MRVAESVNAPPLVIEYVCMYDFYDCTTIHNLSFFHHRLLSAHCLRYTPVVVLFSSERCRYEGHSFGCHISFPTHRLTARTPEALDCGSTKGRRWSSRTKSSSGGSRPNAFNTTQRLTLTCSRPASLQEMHHSYETLTSIRNL